VGGSEPELKKASPGGELIGVWGVCKKDRQGKEEDGGPGETASFQRGGSDYIEEGGGKRKEVRHGRNSQKKKKKKREAVDFGLRRVLKKGGEVLENRGIGRAHLEAGEELRGMWGIFMGAGGVVENRERKGT